MSLGRIYEWAQLEPHREALVWNGTPLTYGAFAQRLETVRQSLRPWELREGSVAVIAIASLLDAWTYALALRSLGIHTVSVASVAGAQALELRNVSCVIADLAVCRRHAPELGGWPGAKLLEHDENHPWENLPGGVPTMPAGDHPEGGHILYTSGTTGTYKKLFLDGEREPARNARRAEHLGLTQDCRWHVAYLGMWTSIGFKMPLAVWHAGGSVLLDQRVGWAGHVVEDGITHAMLLPRMVGDLVKAVDAMRSPRRGHWRLTVTGGFLPQGLARAVLDRLTDTLAITYGSTELSTPALDTLVTNLEEMYWLSESEGRAVEIVDEAGVACPVGVEGHLRVKLAPLDSTEYLDDPEASARMFHDGCFQPGDMALRRADGRIRVVGRSADVLNFQGQKMAAAPMEQGLQERLGGRAVCLFSGLGPTGRDEVSVAVESGRPLEEDELRAIAQQLQPFEQVRIMVCPQFPLTRTGTQKVDRTELKKLLFPAP